MDDTRIWEFEESLWTADAEHYRRSISDEGLMVLPESPFVLGHEKAVETVSQTPRWSTVIFAEQQVRRPQEGLIVIAYRVRAEREGVSPYEAYCSTVYRRLAHEEWDVVQHQQTPALKAASQA
jgi:hypothetical protein